MATNRNLRFKPSRRFGVNVYGHPKALKRQPAEARQKKMSEYGIQLAEKQKVKAMYNLLEKQFYRYYDKAKRMSGVVGENLLFLLETRLDNVVYRAGFARSIRQARPTRCALARSFPCVKLTDPTKCSNSPSRKLRPSIFHISKNLSTTGLLPWFVSHREMNSHTRTKSTKPTSSNCTPSNRMLLDEKDWRKPVFFYGRYVGRFPLREMANHAASLRNAS